MLLNRTKTPVIHMQTPNEEGLERIISMVKEHIANSLGKSEEIKTSTVKEPVRYTEVSFQVCSTILLFAESFTTLNSEERTCYFMLKYY